MIATNSCTMEVWRLLAWDGSRAVGGTAWRQAGDDDGAGSVLAGPADYLNIL